MASFPEPSRAHPIPPSNNGDNDQRDHDLLQSLNTLSLSTSPSALLSPAHDPPPPQYPTERRSSSVSSTSRAPPRTPASRKNSTPIISDPRSTTPNLLRKASMNSLHSATGGATPNKAPSRRASATLFLSPPAVKAPVNEEIIKEKPAPTASSVASAYFAKELELLHSVASEHTAETIVILHDACYGHRFSRPRTSKSLLSTIVERPERIQASIMGVSMAYVRLGERHMEGKHPLHPKLDPKTLPNIPFRIHRTTRSLPLTSPAVTNVHGTKWMDELKIMCNSAESKLAAHANELRRPDINRGPEADPPQQLHQGDLYLCAESLNAFEGALGAVCEAVDAVFSKSSHKRAFVAVRPPGHHCSASFPSGFCWVNNVHVGIMHGILNHGLTHAAIIDFDLHHGDGSQAIAWQHNKRGLTKNAAAWKKTSIGYFSVHDINSYPCEYGDEDKVKNASLCIDNAHGQNIWNVHLHEWKTDVEFWRLYQSKYSILLEKTRNYLRLQTERFRALGQVPKAVIFLSAGFDASEWEGAGMQRHKVNVPTEFYARLTRDVVRIAAEEGLSVDGRVISVLEGGYSDRALYSGVLSHVSGLAGVDAVVPKEEGSSGSAYEMGNRIGSFSRRSTLNENEFKSWKAFEFPYDPHWWSTSELDRFDAARNPQQPMAKKVTRNITPGNYSSPTQSSNAKMTEVAKIRRTLSGFSGSQHAIISRPPTPPPPDVPWTAAAHELSKLLIPNNRQVDSCQHSELNTEAMKTKKERQSLQPRADSASSDAALVFAIPTRMSLRERKPVSYLEDDDTPRRKTVGVASVPATPRGKQARQPSRRLSAASTLDTVQDIPMPAAIPRPDTSQNAQPDPSMTPLSIKKTRPSGLPRKDSARAPGRPRKTKPAAAKGSSAQAPIPQGTSNGNGSAGPAASSTNPDSTSTAKDLDSITNSMRKIKINVLTKEQKEARQKASTGVKQEPTDVLTPTSTSSLGDRPLSLVSTGDASFDPMQSSIDSLGDFRIETEPKIETELEGGAGSLDFGEATPTYDASPITEAPAGFIPLPPTVTTPTEPSPTSTPFASSPLAQPMTEPIQDDDLFVPYQPDGPPPATIPIQRPIQILEPNTGTPAKPPSNFSMPPPPVSSSVPVSPARRMGGHGFTATSSIPFLPRPVQETRSVSRENVPSLLVRPTSRMQEGEGDADQNN
ncbi:hypothetical protein F5Y16DRAFT_321720 [Xylariaceae sp. FL0255]|nr:hypothetical protein F5Y16DRAFT_321720 [Xylariaceae sp. FL0255]